MSAFLCSEKHINTLVAYGVQQDISVYIPGSSGQKYWQQIRKDPDLIVGILTTANVESVNYRYDEDTVLAPVKYESVATAFISPIQIVKLCDCFDYQSCEVDDYEDTTAASIIRTIRNNAISRIPGYDEAEWTI